MTVWEMWRLSITSPLTCKFLPSAIFIISTECTLRWHHGKKATHPCAGAVLCGQSEALTPAQAISWGGLSAQLSDSIETTSPHTTNSILILICNNTSRSLTRNVIRSDPVSRWLAVSGTKVRLVQARANCVSVNQSPPGPRAGVTTTKKSETSREWRPHREQESQGISWCEEFTEAPRNLSPWRTVASQLSSPLVSSTSPSPKSITASSFWRFTKGKQI